MPTRSTTLHTSSAENKAAVSIYLPRNWEELTEAQLSYYLSLVAAGFGREEIKCYFVLRHAGIHPYCKDTVHGADYWYFQTERSVVRIRVEDLAVAAAELDWMDEHPTMPLLLRQIGKEKARIATDLNGLPFFQYLMLENLYQGYLASRQEEPLDSILSVVYGDSAKFADADLALARTAIVFWYAGLKSYFGRKWPDLFRPAAGGANQQSMEQIMNAEIRALTGGDITKEQEIYQTNCWRALEELNAKAREAKEYEQSIKKR